MTIEEASKEYAIPVEVLEEYQSWGLCSAVKSVMGAWQYDEKDIERLSLIMTLHDIGFTNKEVEQYMRLVVAEDNTSEEQMQMLTRLRRKAMNEIHFKQKQLDRLDYLCYEIEKNKKNIPAAAVRKRRVKMSQYDETNPAVCKNVRRYR